MELFKYLNCVVACAIDKIQESILFGHGIGDAQQVLDKNYKNKNFILAMYHGYSTHNQYLDFMMSNGIIGLIGFLAFHGFLLFTGFKRNDVLLISLALIFILQICKRKLIKQKPRNCLYCSIYFCFLF